MSLHLKSNSGNALIQVIIAAGMMAILLSVTVSMISQQTASISYLEDSLSHTALQTELNSVFSNDVLCTQNLIGTKVAPNATSTFVLRDLLGNPIYSPASGQPGKFDQLQVTANLSNATVAGPNSTGAAIVTVNVSRIRSGGGPQVLKPIILTKQVSVDNASQVVACTGGSVLGACMDNVAQLAAAAGTKSMVVPASAKVIEIKFPFGSITTQGHNNGGNGGGSGWTCTWGGLGNAVIHLGVTKLNGVVLQPGKVLQYTMAAGGVGTVVSSWVYDGQVIGRGVNWCGPMGSGPNAWVANVFAGGSTGATCPSKPLPGSASSSSNLIVGFGPNGGKASGSMGYAVIWQ